MLHLLQPLIAALILFLAPASSSAPAEYRAQGGSVVSLRQRPNHVALDAALVAEIEADSDEDERSRRPLLDRAKGLHDDALKLQLAALHWLRHTTRKRVFPRFFPYAFPRGPPVT